jgi:hypothetical protein
MSKAASAKDVRDAFSLPAREAAMAEPAKSGSRNLTVFTGYKGRLYHPQVVLIYWGSAWADAATEPSHAEFTAAINALFTGPWGAQLAKYRGIGPVSLEQVVQVPHLDSPANFSNRWDRTFIDGLITRGTVPAPFELDRPDLLRADASRLVVPRQPRKLRPAPALRSW